MRSVFWCTNFGKVTYLLNFYIVVTAPVTFDAHSGSRVHGRRQHREHGRKLLILSPRSYSTKWQSEQELLHCRECPKHRVPLYSFKCSSIPLYYDTPPNGVHNFDSCRSAAAAAALVACCTWPRHTRQVVLRDSEVFETRRFSKIKGPMKVVPKMRNIVYWGSYGGYLNCWETTMWGFW